MLAISRILCPVDLSDLSLRALRHAVALTQQHHARLRVVLVVDQGLISPAGAGAVAPDVLARFEEDLQWFVAPVVEGEPEVDLVVREGPVVGEILAQAGEMRADVIVLGTHGRGGFERVALGSVAEKVLRKARCPVLVIPHGDAAELPTLPRRVLCPVDFSPVTSRAVAYARFMALTSGAALWLLNVVEWPFGETVGQDAVADLLRSIEADAASKLVEAARPEGPPPIQTFVKRGKPWREILTLARENKVGLIVIGIAGRGVVDLAVLGSTTHHVIREAPCPVLTINLSS